MAMNVPVEARCEPYITSNDYWRSTVASKVIDRMQQLDADPARSSALVIGAGTLPFTLDILPPTIVIADLHASVTNSVLDRCRTVWRGNSWEDYRAAYASDSLISNEFWNMHYAGLVRNFTQAKLAAQRATLIPSIGNVVATAPTLFDTKLLRDKQLTFINFTNIAQYLHTTHGAGIRNRGRTILAGLLQKLPVHEQAVICDSSFGQEVAAYTPDQYIRLANR